MYRNTMYKGAGKSALEKSNDCAVRKHHFAEMVGGFRCSELPLTESRVCGFLFDDLDFAGVHDKNGRRTVHNPRANIFRRVGSVGVQKVVPKMALNRGSHVRELYLLGQLIISHQVNSRCSEAKALGWSSENLGFGGNMAGSCC